MAEDQVALQGFGILGRNLDRCQFAKTGIDPVNRITAFGGGTDHRMGGLDPGLGRRVQLHGGLTAPDMFKIGQFHRRGDQGDGHFASLSNTGFGARGQSSGRLARDRNPTKNTFEQRVEPDAV